MHIIVACEVACDKYLLYYVVSYWLCCRALKTLECVNVHVQAVCATGNSITVPIRRLHYMQIDKMSVKTAVYSKSMETKQDEFSLLVMKT